MNRLLLLLSVFFFAGCGVSGVYIRPSLPASVPPLPADSIRQTLYFIGDAGEPSASEREPALAVLTAMASVQPERNTIIFLGDNIYAKGLPAADAPDRREMERRIDAQIAVGTASGARTIFVPGNHDWEYHAAGGLEAVRREGEYIRSCGFGNITMLPQEGNPGPHAADAGDAVRIIALDTQWWLHAFAKPLYPGDTSEVQTQQHLLDSLTLLLADTGGRIPVVVAHHPFRTYGEHGGFYGWKDHLFPLLKLDPRLWIPLPGIGSLYPLSRMWGISDQDLSGSRNRTMVHGLDSVLSRFHVPLYAAGHEHVLQVLDKEASHYYIVSGNGILKHQEALGYGDRTLMASRAKGFMRLQVTVSGRLRLSVIDAGMGDGTELFSMMLE